MAGLILDKSNGGAALRVKRLRQLCERWIYTTCLCFALDLEEQKRSAVHYQYSVYQMEYSRNLLFQSGKQMDEIFQAPIDRSRAPLDLDRVKTIFGDKHRPHRDTRKKNPTDHWRRQTDTYPGISRPVRLRPGSGRGGRET